MDPRQAQHVSCNIEAEGAGTCGTHLWSKGGQPEPVVRLVSSFATKAFVVLVFAGSGPPPKSIASCTLPATAFPRRADDQLPH